MLEPPDAPAGQAPEQTNQPEPQGGNTAQPTSGDEGADRWKTKFQKADTRNVELSGRLREATEKIGGYEQQIAELTKQNEELMGKASEADEALKGLKGDANRRQMADAVLAKVAPTLQSEASLMLKGLMADEAFQVTHETPADEIAQKAEKALEALKSQATRLFHQAPREHGTSDRPDLSGYRTWHDVPEHLRASASQEDFRRLTGQGGGPQSLYSTRR